jgi:hypothetical protein
VNILDSFDGRLLKLEASILPIHRSTQNLTKLANSKNKNKNKNKLKKGGKLTYNLKKKKDIDSTLKATEHIVDCLNMPSKEEAYILKGYF